MKKTIKLIDLDCGHCADKIQNAVQKIDGVTSVSVNFLGQKMVQIGRASCRERV